MATDVRDVRATRTTRGDRREPGPRFSYAVGMLHRAIRTALTSALQPFDISLPEYTAMSVLSRRAGYSNAQLARRTLVSPQAMNEVIRSLESRGLLERAQSASHKSVRQAHLTRAGWSVLARCDAVVDDLEEVMLANIPRRERRRLIALMVECARTLHQVR